jgi:hypothetical protein
MTNGEISISYLYCFVLNLNILILFLLNLLKGYDRRFTDMSLDCSFSSLMNIAIKAFLLDLLIALIVA